MCLIAGKTTGTANKDIQKIIISINITTEVADVFTFISYNLDLNQKHSPLAFADFCLIEECLRHKPQTGYSNLYLLDIDYLSEYKISKCFTITYNDALRINFGKLELRINFF